MNVSTYAAIIAGIRIVAVIAVVVIGIVGALRLRGRARSLLLAAVGAEVVAWLVPMTQSLFARGARGSSLYPVLVGTSVVANVLDVVAVALFVAAALAAAVRAGAPTGRAGAPAYGQQNAYGPQNAYEQQGQPSAYGHQDAYQQQGQPPAYGPGPDGAQPPFPHGRP